MASYARPEYMIRRPSVELQGTAIGGHAPAALFSGHQLNQGPYLGYPICRLEAAIVPKSWPNLKTE